MHFLLFVNVAPPKCGSAHVTHMHFCSVGLASALRKGFQKYSEIREQIQDAFHTLGSQGRRREVRGAVRSASRSLSREWLFLPGRPVRHQSEPRV